MSIPHLFPGEAEAIATVVALGEQYGYGNLISRLKDAWSRKLQEKHGFDAVTADYAAWQVCPWCDIDSRTGKKSKAAKKARVKK